MTVIEGDFKSCIFGSKTADAGMQENVYMECEKDTRTISVTDTFKNIFLRIALSHTEAVVHTHLAVLVLVLTVT